VLEVVECYGAAPHVVVGASGLLSQLVALKYLEQTLVEGGASTSMSFEASGRNAVPPPRHTLLGLTSISPPASYAALLQNLSYTAEKTAAFLSAHLSLAIPKTRADFRKQLLVFKGEQRHKVVAGALLEGLINMDLLEDALPGTQREKAMPLPDVALIRHSLESVASESLQSGTLEAALRGSRDVALHLVGQNLEWVTTVARPQEQAFADDARKIAELLFKL
jgi:hypothetical protein